MKDYAPRKVHSTAHRLRAFCCRETDKPHTLLQKTYIANCITKKSKRNNGELPMYYVENNHPAIIEREVFDRVQEEISRRNRKRKTTQVGTKTELVLPT